MKFENLTIWIISPEAWGTQKVSKHHYALELARRDNEIVFIEPPQAKNPLREVSQSISAFSFISFPGLRFFPRFLRRHLIERDFRRIQKKTGTRPDVIWSFDNSRLFELDVWKTYVTSLHHVVDLTMDFNLCVAASTSQLCLGTTKFIVAKMSNCNPKSYNIGHGVNLWDRKPTHGKTRRPRVTYTGNLLIRYLNRELVLSAVDQSPDADFIFVGSYSIDNMNNHLDADSLAFIDELKQRSNCYLLGAIEKAAYHNVLDEADIFIVAYRKQYYEQVANPHKMLELLYTGRPIVSNVLDEYTDLKLFDMSDNTADWLALLGEKLENYHSEPQHLIEKRISHALRQSYTQQVNHIEELLNDQG
jgi:hypothetical protein